ncbi:MAG: hypothetical protein ACPG80_02165, partial [Rickettsiales bacterium]
MTAILNFLATDQWGAAPSCPSAGGSGKETCDGDGDHRIDAPDDPGEYGETFTFWQHLANAGLIEGNFTGVAGPDGRSHSIPGENVPRGKLGNSGWYTSFHGTRSGSGSFLDGVYNNTIILGGVNPGDWPTARFISTQDMWNIDSKIDDGVPGTGKLLAVFFSTCSLAVNSA